MSIEIQRNLSFKDRALRIAIGLILVSLAMMHITVGRMLPASIYFAGTIIFEAGIGY